MRLLVTGGSGQLGSEIRDVLAAGAAEIGPIPDVYRNCDVVFVDLDELDVADTSAVDSYFGRHEFDVIINCAAMTNVDGCEDNPVAALQANAIGPRNLAMAADRSGARLVHISTDYVFSGTGERPYREWDQTEPRTVYGASKLLGEQYVRMDCPRSFVVRTSWLYGYHGGNFVKTIAKAAVERGSLQVVDDQRGNPTNANDLAYHLLVLAASDEFGVYHCTGKGECTWYEFALAIVEAFGITCAVEPCSTDDSARPARRPAYSSLDHLMLEATIGDRMRPWREALSNFAARARIEGVTDR